jgi:predicted nucleic acid-binding protein
LAPAQAKALLAQFRFEFAGLFRIVEVTPALIDLAMDLAERHGLRGYDASDLPERSKLRPAG